MVLRIDEFELISRYSKRFTPIKILAAINGISVKNEVEAQKINWNITKYWRKLAILI